MTNREQALTGFLRSRGMAILSAIGAVAMIDGKWPGESPVMLAVVCLVLATGILMVVVNRRFNLLRSLSVYFAGLFMVMGGSSTAACAISLTGWLVPLWALVISTLLFECYDAPGNTKLIFLAFMLVSGAGIISQAFLYYAPVFLLGMLALKCTHGIKPWLAAVIGLMVPWWLLWVFSPCGYLLSMPWHLLPWGSMWWEGIRSTPLPLLILAGSTLLILLAVWMMNLLKIMAYNAHDRSVNGLLSLITVGTWVMAIVDFGNVTFYLPMLFCVLAFQMGHFFRIFLSSRAYIIALAVLGAYIAFYFSM